MLPASPPLKTQARGGHNGHRRLPPHPPGWRLRTPGLVSAAPSNTCSAESSPPAATEPTKSTMRFTFFLLPCLRDPGGGAGPPVTVPFSHNPLWPCTRLHDQRPRDPTNLPTVPCSRMSTGPRDKLAERGQATETSTRCWRALELESGHAGAMTGSMAGHIPRKLWGSEEATWK